MNRQTFASTAAFHTQLDTALSFYSPSRKQPGGVTTRTEIKQIITHERTLAYRIYPHLHPYSQQLVQRLLERSVPGLQSADTEYQVRARLSNAVDATPADDKNVTVHLAKEETVWVPDGQSVRLPDGTLILFAAGKAMKQADGTSITLNKDTVAAILANTQVRQRNGRQLTLKADVNVNLVDGQPRPVLFEEIFPGLYHPSALVQTPYPVKDLDFTSSGAYSVYNWELFFHVPLTIAIHLSKNQRFQEAQRWFHYIFDPTDDREGPTPERFWKVKPFRTTEVKKIEEILVNLATGADEDLQRDTINSIGAWKDTPFRPHVIARYRQSAYMFKTVMAYLDNLIAWGDSLFRQDTRESINEAMIVYVLAANILGPRPQAVPPKGSLRPQTYHNLRDDLDKFGNVMRGMEADLPFDLLPSPTDTADNEQLAAVRGLGKALYFCVPRNDKLLSYWDTVADRLFKIRNSLNIQGIFRQLALFDPPIDPALLARAAAAGLDIGAVISGVNQPLPLVRFQILLAKAAEICQEVKSLGNNLLSAIEKEDNETMAILRAKHERVILGLAENVRYAQLQEAIKSREGLEKSLTNAIQRYKYYERQLGKKDNEITLPELESLDKENLEKMKYRQSEPGITLRDLEIDIAADISGEGGGKKMNTQEVHEMKKLKDARGLQDDAAIKDKIGAGLSLIPELGVDFKFWGIGGHLSFGGSALSRAMSFWASFAKTDAEKLTYDAGNTAKIGSYSRRELDWAFQSNLVAGEITQTFKQLRGAQIREAIAEKEWKNHQQQMKHAEEIEQFLNAEGTEKKGKVSNKALYTWMKREVRGLYGQVFQFAFDVAKKAERALQHELGNTDLSYLQFGYMGGKEGLLAGEKMYFDLKRMEMAYYELNQREYELTKHVSLLQVSPMALIELRTTGKCVVRLPEELFDMDCPGHYFRRIKSVAVSIPCVTGPYTSVNCTLTLLKSSIRKSTLAGDDYARQGADDDRFSDHFGSMQSIVTSTAQNDGGLFETNLRDERYLPFEYSGVISEWQLELPKDLKQFDYDTISDVILHMRYTAREAGVPLRNGAVRNLNTQIDDALAAGNIRLFSVRHEFPTEWAKFQAVKIEGEVKTAELTLPLREEHYPFWSRGKVTATKRLEFIARYQKEASNLGVFKDKEKTDEQGKLPKDPTEKRIARGVVKEALIPTPTSSFTCFLDQNKMDDLFIALTWGK